MAQCVSSPTRTSSAVGTTRVASTTVSRFVTTPPGSVLTSLFTTCSTASNSTICGTSTNVVTQTGTPFTTTGQVVVTVDAPYTYTTILYGSSCTTVPGVVISPTISSPVVSTLTSSSVYTSDGSTYVTIVTSLSSADPPASTSSDSASLPSSNTNNDTNNNIPAIVGGAVGGVAALAVLAFLAWKFLKKPPISFDKEDFSNFNNPTKQEQDSSPYHYAPVGQQENQTATQAFPNDTGPQPTSYGTDATPFSNSVAGGDPFTQYTGPNNNGVVPTMTGNETALQPGISGNDAMHYVPNHGPVHQMPLPSLTPLASGPAAVAAAGPAARPNSTYSSTGYMPGLDPSSQQMYYPPNLGYAPQQYPMHPSVLVPYPQQQPPQIQHQTQRPLSHHLSIGSTMTMTTSSGAIDSSTGPGNVMPSTMIQPGQVYPHHQQSFGQQSYGDSLSASQSVGSTGPPESQALQVRNPGSDSFVQDSSTAVGTPSVVVGSPPATFSPPPIDGKSRPLDTRGEKVAMVHLDGGAYGESSTFAPPAYSE